MARFLFLGFYLILFPITASTNPIFIETEILTMVREVYAIHAGYEVCPNTMDVYGTYMLGRGSRRNSSITSSAYTSDFDHRCLGLGIRVNEDSRFNGRFQSFNLRLAQTDWSAEELDPIQHTHVALIWSQGSRYYTVGRHYTAWSFDLGLQRIDRKPNDRDAVKVSGIIGFSVYLGIYLL